MGLVNADTVVQKFCYYGHVLCGKSQVSALDLLICGVNTTLKQNKSKFLWVRFYENSV